MRLTGTWLTLLALCGALPLCGALQGARPTVPGADNVWHREWITHMDRSLRKLTGSALMPRTPPGAGECSALASNSDLVVVSHGTEAPHPLFNFGTQGALDLWEVDWPTFVAMESRASAEEDERAERERLLALVREQGYVDGYTGVRASSTGQRFRVRDALVWNVQNEDGERLGQAAMFLRAEVEFL